MALRAEGAHFALGGFAGNDSAHPTQTTFVVMQSGLVCFVVQSTFR
jgi:hypothetical protein